MFRRCASVRLSFAGYPRQRAGVILSPQHHHAMFDVAVAAIERGEAFDRAFAGRLGDEVGHRALVAVGLALHAGILRERFR